MNSSGAKKPTNLGRTLDGDADFVGHTFWVRTEDVSTSFRRYDNCPSYAVEFFAHARVKETGSHTRR